MIGTVFAKKYTALKQIPWNMLETVFDSFKVKSQSLRGKRKEMKKMTTINIKHQKFHLQVI